MIGSQDRFALITGATSGIGYELAKLLANDGKSLVIIARDKNKLEQVKTEIENKYRTRVKIIPKDLSIPRAPSEIYSELEKEDVDVDVLINNAGIIVYGPFSETDLQKELEMIQLYTSTLTHMTKLFLKKMLESKSGWILNVSSAMGWMPVPALSVYSAGKAYTLHFSEALANELRGTGVSVTCLCPTNTETEIYKRAGMETAKFARAKKMTAAAVAEAGYKAIKKGRIIANPGLKSKISPIMARVLPTNVLTKVVRAIV